MCLFLCTDCPPAMASDVSDSLTHCGSALTQHLVSEWQVVCNQSCIVVYGQSVGLSVCWSVWSLWLPKLAMVCMVGNNCQLLQWLPQLALQLICGTVVRLNERHAKHANHVNHANGLQWNPIELTKSDLHFSLIIATAHESANPLH